MNTRPEESVNRGRMTGKAGCRKIKADEIINGDCLCVLKEMPDESVHCCVTSPPYYGLRDYGIEGQIGREAAPEQYIRKLTEIFQRFTVYSGLTEPAG